MCGRYRRQPEKEELARIYHIPIPAQPDLPISYNIAPNQPVLAIPIQSRDETAEPGYFALGHSARFCAATEKLIERGTIHRGGITEAVEAILANRNAKRPVETIVLSSTHRVAEKVSDKLHEAHKTTKPELAMAQIAAFKVKALQPAELLSTASYRPGEIIDASWIRYSQR
jgi:hypothetical protein